MSDCILRGEVISAIEMLNWYHISNGKLVQGASSDSDALYKAEDIFDAINNIQIAITHTARKHGKWIRVDENNYRCSECGQQVESSNENYNSPLDADIYFCPRCGSDMSEGDGAK